MPVDGRATESGMRCGRRVRGIGIDWKADGGCVEDVEKQTGWRATKSISRADNNRTCTDDGVVARIPSISIGDNSDGTGAPAAAATAAGDCNIASVAVAGVAVEAGDAR